MCKGILKDSRRLFNNNFIFYLGCERNLRASRRHGGMVTGIAPSGFAGAKPTELLAELPSYETGEKGGPGQ
jgi:hypothetical protein